MSTVQSMREEISTHRVLQLSKLADSLLAISTQCDRAATNAASINNFKAANHFANRARKARWALATVQARLERAERQRQAATCGSRVELPTPRRPANALNLEVGAPMTRCLSKRPSHWPASASSLRWIASGGDALVFGVCSADCPMRSAS
jgi:hypothetical protein